MKEILAKHGWVDAGVEAEEAGIDVVVGAGVGVGAVSGPSVSMPARDKDRANPQTISECSEIF